MCLLILDINGDAELCLIPLWPKLKSEFILTQTFTCNLNPIVTHERERKKANTAPRSPSGRLINSNQSNHTAIEQFTTLNPAVI